MSIRVVLAFPRPCRRNRWDLRGWSKACGGKTRPCRTAENRIRGTGGWDEGPTLSLNLCVRAFAKVTGDEVCKSSEAKALFESLPSGCPGHTSCQGLCSHARVSLNWQWTYKLIHTLRSHANLVLDSQQIIYKAASIQTAHCHLQPSDCSTLISVGLCCDDMDSLCDHLIEFWHQNVLIRNGRYSYLFIFLKSMFRPLQPWRHLAPLFPIVRHHANS